MAHTCTSDLAGYLKKTSLNTMSPLRTGVSPSGENMSMTGCRSITVKMDAAEALAVAMASMCGAVKPKFWAPWRTLKNIWIVKNIILRKSQFF